MLERLKLQCWNCQKVFELTMETNADPRIIKACVGCGEQVVIDLSPYQNSEVTMLKSEPQGDGPTKEAKTERPDIIPTSALGKEESTPVKNVTDKT